MSGPLSRINTSNIHDPLQIKNSSFAVVTYKKNKMKRSKIFVLSFVAITFMVPLCYAQNSPRDYLQAHNAARASVGVQPLTWDAKLAAYAHNYVNQRIGDCRLVTSNGPYGENLARSRGDLTGTGAVALWVAQKPNYDYNSNSCVRGECHRYTQVVWRHSARLGCARVECYNGGTIVSCNYDPPGNYENQRPY